MFKILHLRVSSHCCLKVSENDKMVANLQLQNSIGLPGSMRPAILSSGLKSPEELEEIVESARDEVENMRLKQYVQVRYIESGTTSRTN